MLAPRPEPPRYVVCGGQLTKKGNDKAQLGLALVYQDRVYFLFAGDLTTPLMYLVNNLLVLTNNPVIKDNSDPSPKDQHEEETTTPGPS